MCQGRPEKAEKPSRPLSGNTKRNKQKHIRPIQHETVNDSSSDSDDYLYSMQAEKSSPKVNVKMLGHKFQMTIDTGATINVIDRKTFQKLENVTLRNTNTQAYAYSNKTPVDFLGKFETIIEIKRRYTVGVFYVVNEYDSACLLSSQTAQELGLISLHLNKIKSTPNIVNETIKDAKLSQPLSKHKEVFTGLGKLKGHMVKLNIDKEITPTAQPQRRIPFHIREKVGEALKELESEGIIKPVPDDQPTPWVSPIVAVPKKDGSVRICVDMRLANQTIQRVRHLIPTVEDVSLDLNGAQYLSKLDLTQAYHQLELDSESRYITTFSTHLGLYRYTHLNYGTNAAAEVFQNTLQQHLQGIDGVKNIADDILIFGRTRKQHDQALDKCLTRLSEKGLTLNRSKCKFLNTTLEFFGQIFSKDGTHPDPKRVEDLLNAPRPTNVHEVCSLLDMANYSSKYIHDYATITAPLRELTKKNVKFKWTYQHQQAFETLSQALTSAPVMAYFDVTKETLVTVDASPVGISAILGQRIKETDDYRVVAYASRALTAVERRYSQTEREAVAIVWAVEHYHLFLFGANFTLITDHKPLELIYGSPKSKPSARIERWVLRLQPYDFAAVYKSGTDNSADYMSRHPTKFSTRKQERITEAYVNFVARNAVPKAMTLTEIQEATNNDQTMKGLRASIRLNQWDNDIVKPYKSVKDELTVTSENIILRGTRIVIPESLQQKAIDLAHESHQGLAKTKALSKGTSGRNKS